MPRHFEPSARAPVNLEAPAWYFLFAGHDLVVVPGAPCSLPGSGTVASLEIPEDALVCVGALDGIPCHAAAISPEAVTPGCERMSLRSLHGRLEEDLYAIAGRAIQLLRFAREHRHCGACGTAMEQVAHEHARLCPACGLQVYPRLSPAVIVLIHHERRVLLGWGRRFPEPVYSTLAGFVEPGESVEEAIHRELFEEVGVRVKNLRYFGSQAWPYPHALMLGFLAEWAEGEIRIQESELVDAQWFSMDALPRLPPPVSIARRMIDAFVQGTGS